MPKAYYIQFLSKGSKDLLDRELIHSMSAETIDFDEWKEAHPELFKRIGLYSLLEVVTQIEVSN